MAFFEESLGVQISERYVFGRLVQQRLELSQGFIWLTGGGLINEQSRSQSAGLFVVRIRFDQPIQQLNRFIPLILDRQHSGDPVPVASELLRVVCLPGLVLIERTRPVAGGEEEITYVAMSMWKRGSIGQKR